MPPGPKNYLYFHKSGVKPSLDKHNVMNEIGCFSFRSVSDSNALISALREGAEGKAVVELKLN